MGAWVLDYGVGEYSGRESTALIPFLSAAHCSWPLPTLADPPSSLHKTLPQLQQSMQMSGLKHGMTVRAMKHVS